MSTVPVYLKNHEAVVGRFGYWPDFHDSPVLSFRADSDSIHLEVEAWEIGDGVDTRGHFHLTKRSVIAFDFEGIVWADLERFVADNILFEIGFSSEEERQCEGAFRVALVSAMGSDLGGEFKARAGWVSCAPASG